MMGHNKRQMMDSLGREADQELLKTVSQECRMRRLFMWLIKGKKIWEAYLVLSLLVCL